MRGKLRHILTTKRALVAVVGVLLALAWAIPSIGAGTASVARKAFARANLAIYHSNLAIDTSNKAKTTANEASATANAAQATAGQAQSTANTAQSTATSALNKANSIVTASYGRMNQPCSTSATCSVDRARGVTIRQTSSAGTYCVSASSRTPGSSSWLVSVDAGDTGSPETTQAFPDSGAGCNASEFGVRTLRSGSGVSDVAFFVVIP